MCQQFLCYIFHHNCSTANFVITGIITNGGAKPNIIPELSELVYYLRAPTDTELAVLKAKVIGCIQGAATATGCQVCKYFLTPSLLQPVKFSS